MVNAAREPLHDDVEMDDTWVGGPQPGLRGSRQLKGRKAALVLVAVEKRGDVSGRVRMAALLDLKEATVHAFVKQHIAPGSTLYTDAYKSFDDCRRQGSGTCRGTKRPGWSSDAVLCRSFRWQIARSGTCNSG